MNLPFRTAFALTAMAACLVAAPALAAPSTWTVDKAASKLSFKSKFGGDAFEGAFRRWDAQIVFDPKQLAASKAVVSIDMTSAVTGDTSRDETMPSADWFSAKQFPRATFTTTSFKSLGGNRYQAAGNLVIRGVSKPIVLPFTLDIAGDVAKMNGSVAVRRTLFGVGQGEFESAETVPLDVAVNVVLTAHKAK